MTDPTARDLIKRLTDELEFWSDLACTPSELPLEQDDMLKLITEARAYLAQPEPEGPTYEELCDLMYEFTISTGHGEQLDEIGFARALLARWGNRSAPQPIPVSERLPGPEDCDAEGRFWWWYPPALETYGCWVYEDYAANRAYEEWPSAWLPANALPLPEEVV